MSLDLAPKHSFKIGQHSSQMASVGWCSLLKHARETVVGTGWCTQGKYGEDEKDQSALLRRGMRQQCYVYSDCLTSAPVLDTENLTPCFKIEFSALSIQKRLAFGLKQN